MRKYSSVTGAVVGLLMAAGLALAQSAVDSIEVDADTARLYRLEEQSSCWHRPIPDAQVDALVSRVTRQYEVRELVVVMRSLPDGVGVTSYHPDGSGAPALFIVALPENDPLSRWLVLHELSHVIQVSRLQKSGHGDEFRKILAHLVEKEIDAACAADFRRRLADPRS